MNTKKWVGTPSADGLSQSIDHLNQWWGRQAQAGLVSIKSNTILGNEMMVLLSYAAIHSTGLNIDKSFLRFNLEAISTQNTDFFLRGLESLHSVNQNRRRIFTAFPIFRKNGSLEWIAILGESLGICSQTQTWLVKIEKSFGIPETDRNQVYKIPISQIPGLQRSGNVIPFRPLH